MNIVNLDWAIQHSNYFLNPVDHPICTIVCTNCDFPQINNSLFPDKEKLLTKQKLFFQLNKYHEVITILKDMNFVQLKLNVNLRSTIYIILVSDNNRWIPENNSFMIKVLEMSLWTRKSISELIQNHNKFHIAQITAPNLTFPAMVIAWWNLLNSTDFKFMTNSRKDSTSSIANLNKCRVVSETFQN